MRFLNWNVLLEDTIIIKIYTIYIPDKNSKILRYIMNEIRLRWI